MVGAVVYTFCKRPPLAAAQRQWLSQESCEITHGSACSLIFGECFNARSNIVAQEQPYMCTLVHLRNDGDGVLWHGVCEIGIVVEANAAFRAARVAAKPLA